MKQLEETLKTQGDVHNDEDQIEEDDMFEGILEVENRFTEAEGYGRETNRLGTALVRKLTDS